MMKSNRKPIGVIQARMSSVRLPGKVLQPLAGRPMIAYLFDRLQRCRSISGFILATSRREDDDPLADFCKSRGVACFRGSLGDVAGRFLSAMEAFEAESAVRICGDSPLLDTALIDRVVRLYGAASPDLATNVHPRTFPPGQSVEIFSYEALSRAHHGMTRPAELEHVTKKFYDSTEEFRIVNLAADAQTTGGLKNPSLAVDTYDDFLRMETILARMDRPHWEYDWREIVALSRPAQGAGTGNQHAV